MFFNLYDVVSVANSLSSLNTYFLCDIVSLSTITFYYNRSRYLAVQFDARAWSTYFWSIDFTSRVSFIARRRRPPPLHTNNFHSSSLAHPVHRSPSLSPIELCARDNTHVSHAPSVSPTTISPSPGVVIKTKRNQNIHTHTYLY